MDAKWPDILDGAKSTRNRAKEKGALGAVLREDEFLEEIFSVVIVKRVASFPEKKFVGVEISPFIVGLSNRLPQFEPHPPPS